MSLRSHRVPLSLCTHAGWLHERHISLEGPQVYVGLLGLQVWQACCCARPFHPTMLPTERPASPVPASAELSPIFQQTLDVVPDHVNLEPICPSAKDRSRKLCSWTFPHLPDRLACSRAGLAPRQWSLWGRQGAGSSGNCLCGFEACLRARIVCGVWWSYLQIEVCAAHKHYKRFSKCTSALRVLAVGVLVPLHSGHCISTALAPWWSRQPPPPSRAFLQRGASDWFTTTVF